MERQNLHVILVGAAALLLLVGLLTPWWTVHGEATSGGATNENTESAGPFAANDGLIEDGQAILTGLLVLLAFLATVTALVFVLTPAVPDNVRAQTPWPLLGAAVVALLAILLAATTWPPEDIGFWDSESSSFSGFGMSMQAEATFYANAGWYLTVLAVPVLAFAGIDFVRNGSTQAAGTGTGPAKASNPTPAGRCQATTKAGNPCSRSATRGEYCGTHA